MPAPPPRDRTAAHEPGGLVVPVRRIWLVGLLAAGVLLALVSVALQLAKEGGFDPPSLQLDRLLNADEDLSVLNWLTASTFLLAALAAWAAAAARRADRLVWLAACVVLLLVSLDEAVGVHDPVSVNAEEQLRAGGAGAAGVLLAGLLVGAAVVVVVLRLEPAVRWRVAGVLVLLVVAAVAIDAAGPDLVDDPAARLEAAYVAKSTLEEMLELGAAVLALDAMLLAALTR